MKILELFAGSRSFGKVAESMGHTVFSVDWQAFDGIDLQLDIEQLNPNQVPFNPDLVWASPDCTTYSIAACSTHRNLDRTPKTEYAKKCDAVNRHLIELLDHWETLNPSLVYFIENPRGMLRHMDFMQRFDRRTIWYCRYGDTRAKPTDIFTNSNNWTPRKGCRNFKYSIEGKIIDRHCHHEPARRGAKTGTQGLKGSYNRSVVPSELCQEILDSH